MFEESEELLMIDEWVERLSTPQMQIVTIRAIRELGYDADFIDDVVTYDEDLDIEEDEDFLEVWEDEAVKMVLNHATNQLVKAGALKIVGIDLVSGDLQFYRVPGAVEPDDYDGPPILDMFPEEPLV